MTKLGKILYILGIILLAISAIGGGIALAGFFFDRSQLQLIGLCILIISYLISLILDFVSGRRKNKNDR